VPRHRPPHPPHPPLDTPLHDVTFVVLDLETTGAAPGADRITEIGALKVRAGDLLGEVDTLVNPGVPIPPMVTVLTGITETMVAPAPEIGPVLPCLLEFVRNAVIVGHNIRFDCSFLDAALVEHGYPPLSNRRVDTMALARRLARDDVQNLRLHTLAQHFRTATKPVHRAYADAAATTDLFHALLERAAFYGVFGLDDLVALPSIRVHPSMAKLALTARLPRQQGVFWFRDRDGTVVYVGKAANIRTRVRAFFCGADRRVAPQLLREATAIDHRVCAGALESSVRELRLVQQLRPRFNRNQRTTTRDDGRPRVDRLATLLQEQPFLAFDTADGRIEVRHGNLVLPDDERSMPDNDELQLIAHWLARRTSRARRVPSGVTTRVAPVHARR
jgi:DNA polymerase-3 subunit epsilon